MSSTAPDPVTADDPSPGSPWRGVLLESLGVLAVFTVVGAAAGWLWERWASPPSGVVLDGTWRLGARIDGDFLVRDTDALDRTFGVVGTFVVVGSGVGLLLGVLAAFVCRRSELVTLAAVAVSSVLAVLVCYRVGLALGPGDPDVAAETADTGTVLTGNLAIDQLSPFVGLPLGALVGLAVSYLTTTGVSAGVGGSRQIELGAPRGVSPLPSHD